MYRIKWKDSAIGETWEISHKVIEKYNDLYQRYIAEEKKRNEVVAILSYRTDKHKQLLYLIKWKDESRGKTWEPASRMASICPDLIDNFREHEPEKIINHKKIGPKRYYLIKWKDSSIDETWESHQKVFDKYYDLYQSYMAEEKKRNEVVAIISHKRDKNQSMYLVKWKDGSRGKTWEPASKLGKICPDLMNNYTENEVEKIIAHKQVENERQYLLKWKDKSESWEGPTVLVSRCHDLFRAYIAEHEQRSNVEAIISSKKYNDKHWRYLIKWKRNTIGETWETSAKMLSICPDLIKDYRAGLEKESGVEAIISHRTVAGHREYLVKWKDSKKGETCVFPSILWSANNADLINHYKAECKKRNEVEAIISHKKDKSHFMKYLIKWKDHSRVETWEKHKEIRKICPEMLKEYTEVFQKEDSVKTKKKSKKSRESKYSKKNKTKDSDESDDDESVSVEYDDEESGVEKSDDAESGDEKSDDEEWEVERIVDVRNKKDKSREFLVHWKGYASKYDSWEPENGLNCPDLIVNYLAKLYSNNRSSKRQ